MNADDERDALEAVAAIIDDFGHNRAAEYFSRFAADATFIFHTTPQRLESRADYEALWARWQREDGFEVLGCLSTDQHIQIFGDVAVFSHSVETILSVNGETQTENERETIVMQRRDDRWVCVHEHLSGRD